MRYHSEDASGKRAYTLKSLSPAGNPTKSAHPARFTPHDQYSRERILCKKRFGLLLTQQPPLAM